MSGGSGQSGLLPMKKDVTKSTGRHLLVRQPLPLATGVPLDGVAISNMKQQLPVFRAIELTTLNKRFAETCFEQPTVKLDVSDWPWLGVEEEPGMVKVLLRDRAVRKQSPYKERKRQLPIGDLAAVLKSIAGKRIIHTLATDANDTLLERLLEMEPLSPSCLEIGDIVHYQVDISNVARYNYVVIP